MIDILSPLVLTNISYLEQVSIRNCIFSCETFHLYFFKEIINSKMKIGYIRVPAAEQSLDLQTDALNKIDCRKIFTETENGSSDSRIGLNQAIEYCRKGDALVVWKLDRLGGGIRRLIDTINVLRSKGIDLISLEESIDTTVQGGQVVFNVFGAIAKFEREFIRERTRAGIAAAREKGVIGGRPKKLNPKQIKMAQKLIEEGGNKMDDIAKTLKISRSTLYRYKAPKPKTRKIKVIKKKK